MFTGVVVENFSYVFQLTGEMSITREEMRSFKKVWAEFDPDRSGYLPRSKFVPFFAVSLNNLGSQTFSVFLLSQRRN
jgi:Ca2+-binding EF-hand superfamily protein